MPTEWRDTISRRAYMKKLMTELYTIIVEGVGSATTTAIHKIKGNIKQYMVSHKCLLLFIYNGILN